VGLTFDGPLEYALKEVQNNVNETSHEKPETKVGRIAAIAVSAETILFAVSLIIGLTIRSRASPIASWVVCILLAASVIVMMAAVYLRSRDGRRIWGLLALCAAIVYAPFVMAVYFIQIAVVTLNPLGLTADVLKLVAFAPGSQAFALDMLGYAFLCLSTFAAAFTLNDPKDKALRILCFAHGALALPTLAAPIISGIFGSASGQSSDIGSFVLLVWCAIFAPIALLFVRHFQRGLRDGS
jgi:hypothetical protein